MIGAQIKAFLLLPGTVVVIIPSVLLFLDNSAPVTSWIPSTLTFAPVVVGIAFMLLGALLLFTTNRQFFHVGRGTLAPWSPPLRLVVAGVYRYVRNPMISGVFAILLGEAVAFGSIPLFLWFLGFLIANLFHIPFIEERSLERRFGEAYRLYKQNVPRWIPRLTPWEQSTKHSPHVIVEDESTRS
jgi:protein-S-isoprenylcysteine O-methyltransferase Ste14